MINKVTRLMAQIKTEIFEKISNVCQLVSGLKYRRLILVSTLIALSAYKPIALFQTLSLAQTFMNIFINCFIDVTVGAAVFMHNFLT